MSQLLKLEYDVEGGNFVSAGTASEDVKMTLKKLGLPSATIKRVAIAMYEGEINMVIHANGGKAYVDIYSDKIVIVLQDVGPGIPDIDKAMQEGFSTAPDAIRSLGFGAGMGLPNMKKNSDSLKIETEIGKGSRIEMIVNLA